MKNHKHQKESMFKIEFYLENENKHWSTEINQLNSDILRRHIYPKINANLYDLQFSYSELDSQGNILSEHGVKLGTFKIT